VYNSQEIAGRIKLVAKQKQKPLSEVLSACKLGKNTISNIHKGNDILTLNFAKIADYLDCSIDYLLGREYSGDSISVSASNISGSTVVQGKQMGDFVFDKSSSQSSTPSSTQNHSEEEAELLRIFNTISVRSRAKLMTYAFDLEEKDKSPVEQPCNAET